MTCLKEFFLGEFAARFQAAGFASLVYDNRNFGQSGGLPRFEVDAVKQIEDYHDAITYAQTLPEVDPNRIAIWGTSYSGGNVLQVGAIDTRVKAVIAQVPFVSGHNHTMALNKSLPTIMEDRARLAEGGEGAVLEVVAASPEEAQAGTSEAILPELDAWDFFTQTSLEGGAKWVNKMTVQSLLKMLKNEPRAYVKRISPTPLLMVIAEEDRIVDVSTQLAAYGEAEEPKELLFMANTGHFEPYSGEKFDGNVMRQIAFLNKYLVG